MCMKSILSMFRYLKPQVLDKEGMVRNINWKEFTLSQRSDVYEENYSYTVARDDKNSNVYLYYQTIAESGESLENGIRLKKKTVKEIQSMRFMDYPDEEEINKEKLEELLGEEVPELLDGTYVKFSVLDEFGNRYNKDISIDDIERLQKLFLPYL